MTMAKDKDPLKEELDRLGLNEPKSEKQWESVERRIKKFRIARDSDASDAREREDSAHTALMTTALDASLDRKRGTDNSNKKYAEHKKWSENYAKEQWGKGSNAKPGEMAKQIHGLLRGAALQKEVPHISTLAVDTITGWIKSLAPVDLQGKPGRPRKP